MRANPPHLRAAYEALQFLDARPEALRTLSRGEWEDLLARWDFVRLTIPLRHVCGAELPDWVRSRIEENLARNAQRFERIKSVYAAAAGALHAAQAEHVVLKGFAQWPSCLPHPGSRSQSDIDLYCPPPSLERARDALAALGYRPEMQNGRYADHLPAMALPTEWRWRGDFYDPEMPVSFELHFCFWNTETLRLAPTGLEQFWERRVERRVDSISFPALNCVDSLAYGALNCLRDLLRGTPSAFQVYELAWFLHASAEDAAFWEGWRAGLDPALRRFAAISFRLARDWFACRLPREVAMEIGRLPPRVLHWLEQCAEPLRSRHLHPNKDGMWLHLRLLESKADRRDILLERLFPTRPPARQADRASADAGQPEGSRLQPIGARAQYLARVAARLVHHAALLPATLWRGASLWLSEKGLSRGFWNFFAVSFLYNLGMFVFFILFNLYLLDRGFHDKFLGLATSATALGSVAGTLPFGLLAHRLGLRKALIFCLGIVPLVSAGLVVIRPAPALLTLAFIAGAVSTLWEVITIGAVAQLTNDGNRSFGFSLIFASGIAVGILGSAAGGAMPGWLVALHPLMSAARAKQWALLAGCGLAAAAVWPALRLRFAPPPPREKKFCPGSPFLYRFLAVIGLWSLVTGAFSPFFNAYFSEHIRLPLRGIGWVSSLSQLTQALAMLAAPLVFRRFGLVNGIVYTQVAAAVSLAGLAGVARAGPATGIYIGFSAFLWMSQPGIYSLLMSRVAPEEQTGASTLNFLVIAVAQAIAAAAAGASFERFGYPVVMVATAAVALTAALAFRFLLGGRGAATAGSFRQVPNP